MNILHLKTPKCCHITPILHSLHWLKITECIKYKLLSLTYKVLTTTQPPYFHNRISVPKLITVILCYNLPKSQITRLQQIQNSLVRVDVKTPKCCHITPILHSLHWLKVTERIEYKLLSLTCKVLTTTQPPYLHNLISVQPPRNTRSSSHVTLARPPALSSLRITDRSFRYALPCLWNQLPSSLRQPHSSPSVSDLPVHASATFYSFNSPLSPPITTSLSLPAQDLPFSQIFPTIDSLPASGLTPRLHDWTVSYEHLGF